MNRRHFLGSILGLAATPLITPKRSFFYFSQSYKLDPDSIVWQEFPPMIDQDSGRFLRGVLIKPHVKLGKQFDGFFITLSHVTKENMFQRKKDGIRLIEQISSYPEIKYMFASGTQAHDFEFSS